MARMPPVLISMRHQRPLGGGGVPLPIEFRFSAASRPGRFARRFGGLLKAVGQGRVHRQAAFVQQAGADGGFQYAGLMNCTK
jgi:hypothetical protein